MRNRLRCGSAVCFKALREFFAFFAMSAEQDRKGREVGRVGAQRISLRIQTAPARNSGLNCSFRRISLYTHCVTRWTRFGATVSATVQRRPPISSCAPVAQRLEQQTHNLLVRGSNPCGGTKSIADCRLKTADFAFRECRPYL